MTDSLIKVNRRTFRRDPSSIKNEPSFKKRTKVADFIAELYDMYPIRVQKRFIKGLKKPSILAVDQERNEDQAIDLENLLKSL